MKLNENIQFPNNPESDYDRRLYQVLYKWSKDVAVKVNQIADGEFAGFDLTGTAAPTTGTYRQGDQIKNSNPTVLGTAGSRYVIVGWICVASGSPGTWAEMRTLTGT